MIADCFRALGEGISYGIGHGIGLAVVFLLAVTAYRMVRKWV